jgi:hypothetical protein
MLWRSWQNKAFTHRGHVLKSNELASSNYGSSAEAEATLKIDFLITIIVINRKEVNAFKS